MRATAASILVLLSLLASILAAPFAIAADAGRFSHPGIAREAESYATYIAANWSQKKGNVKALLTRGQSLVGQDPREASRAFAAAAGAAPGEPAAWLGLARALIGIAPDKLEGAERYNVPVNASGAAYRAYELAKDDAARAEALAVLSDTLVRRQFWRPAIDAMKLSVALAGTDRTRAAYEELVATHGFRMTDYATEAETSEPRLCLEFSEPLSRGQQDFASFVSVGGRDPQAVSAEGSRLCVEGLSHGERYEVQVRAGLPSDVGESLRKTVDIAVYMPDRKPSVRFTGKSYVLPSRGQQGIPVVSVNTDGVEVEVYRVGDRSLAGIVQNGDLDRQLGNWELEAMKDRTGERIYAGTLEVQKTLNKEVTTAFPVSEAIGTLKPGAYAMIARATAKTGEYEYQVATQWFIVSDLGLTAFTGTDGITAFVRSLSGAKPVGDVEVRIVARNNEVLGTATSDALGQVRFDAGLTRGEGGLQPALLVAQQGATDYAFLDLSASAFDLTDRGVDGRAPAGPIDAYLYTERGVYRPGEDVHLSALVRDASGNATGLPVTLILTRPDGVEHRRMTLSDAGLGGRSATVTLSGGAMTGTWRAKVHVDPERDAIAQASFLVEDFVPERLDMTLAAETPAIGLEAPGRIRADGKFLYGPPAAGLSLEGEVVVRAATAGIAGYEGYVFGQWDEEITAVREDLAGLPATDAAGKATLDVALPEVPKTARPLEAQVLLRLAEPGGRTIERSIKLPVDLGMPRVGIKPAFDGGSIGEGETARFDVVLLGGDGRPVTGAPLNWQLKSLDTRWQWYSRDGSWSYESITLKRKIGNGTIATGESEARTARIEMPVGYGRYVLEVSAGDGSGAVSSYAFSAGWYHSADAPDSPEMLDVALDKETYKPGETAKLRIASRHGGTALVAVLGSGVKWTKEVQIAPGGGDVEIPVADGWGAGAYATALLYRPLDEAAKRMPERSLGIAWIGLDQTARTLDVAIETPDMIRSGESLTVPVSVGGLAAGETARITIAAVDVGILNLTRYNAPSPRSWFHKQTLLGTQIRDVYGRLIDGMRAERGRLRSGGDGDGGMQMDGSPPVEATVAEYSGIVEVGPDGRAEVQFALPDFNGAVRIMAVAWTEAKLGDASREVIVRDKVAMTIASPRFLTLGDEVRLGVDLHNVDGPQGAYELEIAQETAAGERKLIEGNGIELKPGERVGQTALLSPKDVGRQTYRVSLSGPGDVAISRTLSIDVKPPAGGIKRTTVASLKPGATLSLSPDLVEGLIASRSEVAVAVGPTARFDVPGLIAQLDRYPYGCAEQTVSRALPLVYASAVARRSGIVLEADIASRVQGAIDRVLEMQDSSGAFGAWGPSYTNLWLTSFVTDFLTRAKESGFKVDDLAFGQALDRLANFIAYAQDFEKGGEDRAYALYVLARNGRAPAGELRYYADTRLDRFATPLAKAQIGAALAMLGDKDRAKRAFSVAAGELVVTAPADDTLARWDYGTELRDRAAYVALASETGVTGAETQRLADLAAAGYLAKRYTSTQEQAWLLLAVKALGEETEATQLEVGGTLHKGPLVEKLSAEALIGGGARAIVNRGEEPVDAVISVVGDALTPEPEVANGFTLSRAYYTLDGQPVDLASATGGSSTVKQNERFVVVLRVETRHAGGRILLVDRLPAGLEIENPRLVQGGDISGLDWLTSAVSAQHSEFRDDRFVASFNLFDDNNNAAKAAGTVAAAAYVVRAVTPGSFVHPAATVEDMYVPERHARTAAGRLTVSAGR